MKDECDAAYRRIFIDKKDKEKQTKNIRVDKVKLKNYLTRHYNKRLASKMIVCIDWTNLTDSKHFYNQFEAKFLGRTKEENFNSTGADQSTYNRTEHMNQLKLFAFNLLDMNCDNYVCEADLFSYMKNLKDDEFFRKILLQDITDI